MELMDNPPPPGATVFVLAGIMLPSLTSAVYFFIFLFLCTWWSLCRTFDTLLFSCMCVLMAIFSAGHIIVLYLYQFQFFQESIPPEDSLIRSDRGRPPSATRHTAAIKPWSHHAEAFHVNEQFRIVV